MLKKSVAAAVLCALLAGCAPQTDGAAQFIDPLHNGGETLIADRSPTVSAAPQSDSETLFTENAQWEVRDGCLMHEEFVFHIPPAWQDNFVFRPHTKTVLGETVRIFDLCYRVETGDELCLVRVECYPTALAEGLQLTQSRSGTFVDRSGTRTYLLAVRLESIPEQAPYTGECVDIAGALMEDSGFVLRV